MPIRIPAAVAALAVGVPAVAADPTPLFNGKDLAGWRGWAIHDNGGSPADVAGLSAGDRAARFAGWTAAAAKHWTVEGGELVNDGHGPFLATAAEFADYELRLEYNIAAGADSGVYLKGSPQVQVWDPADPANAPHGAAKGSGGLWNNPPGLGKDPRVKADRPAGEWNALRVVQVGARTTVHLNGTLVVDHAPLANYWDNKAPLPPRGPILLQTHGGKVRWRNLAVRELSADEANAVLRSNNADGFEPIFDGTSLAGWAGAVDDYEVKDGAVVCKPGKGGELYTAAEYADFTARVEFKLPPGGNNGLAVRYPGTGVPAYTGMCEVQVLDDTAAKYATLDPRQYCGSAYGMAAAARGHLRPVGAWNFIEVTARGSRVTVELNGSVVTDADLAAVTDYMANTPHPGKLRPAGRFGFAGHSDPVAFRNVAIKRH